MPDETEHRLVYGLEFQSKKVMKALEKLHNMTLRHNQHLPDRTASTATISLLGILPMDNQLDKNILNMFYNITSDRNSVLFDIAERRLAVKSIEDKSIFSLVRRTLGKYNLPTAYDQSPDW